MMGLLTYTHLWIFFLILISVFRSERQFMKLFEISLGVSILISIYGLWQKLILANVGRVESTFGNSAFLATYLLAHVFIALFLLTRSRKLDFKGGFYLMGLFLNVLVVFLTGTRGAMLGLFVGAFVLLLSIIFSKKYSHFWLVPQKTAKVIALGIISFLIIAAGSVWIFRENIKGTPFVPLDRIAAISFSDRTIQGRLLSWGVAIEGIKERPILGWGPENFLLLFNKHYDPKLFAQEAWFDRSHNIFLDLTSTLGALGLLGFLFLISAVIWLVYKKSSERWSFSEKAVMVSFGVAYLVNAQFVFDNAATLIPLCLLFSYLAAGYEEISFIEDKRSSGLKAAVITLSVILMSFVIWHVNVLPLRENFASRKALEALYSNKDKSMAINQYREALKNNPYGDTEPRRFFADFFFIDIKRAGLKLSPEVEGEMFGTALEFIGENRKLDPQNARWTVYEANLLILASSINPEYSSRAEKLILDNLSLSPTRQQVYFDLAQAQFDQGKIDETFRTIDTAIKLEPRYPLAHRHKASFAILSGRDKTAEEEINWLRENSWERADNSAEKGWHMPRADFEVLSNIYFRAGNNEKALYFYKLLVDLLEEQRDDGGGPTDGEMADFWARLAALFALSADNESAYQAALRVIELDPSPERKREAEAFLKTIGRAF
jgi:O-antigen ligase